MLRSGKTGAVLLCGILMSSIVHILAVSVTLSFTTGSLLIVYSFPAHTGKNRRGSPSTTPGQAGEVTHIAGSKKGTPIFFWGGGRIDQAFVPTFLFDP